MLKVGIAPGHGEGDPGAVGPGVTEHPLAGVIARSMTDHLEEDNVDVVYQIGVRDVPDRIRWQAEFFNDNEVDLAVQIHLNAFSSDDAHGSEAWVYAPGGERTLWASKMAGAMALFFHDRGVKNKAYTFLQATKMPAVIIEAGFLSNSEDRKVILTQAKEIGTALAKATMDYAGVTPLKIVSRSGKDYYRVFDVKSQVGAYNKLSNALSHAERILLLGHDVRITSK